MQEASASLGFEFDVQKHASNSLLDKVFYRHDSGRVISQQTTNNMELRNDAKDNASVVKAVEVLGGGEPSSKVVIKIENPEFATIKGHLNTLKSGKTALEKAQSQAKDLVALLQSKQDPDLQGRVDELQALIKIMSECLGEARGYLPGLAATKAKDDLTGVVDKNARLIATVSAHVDGWKTMKKAVALVT